MKKILIGALLLTGCALPVMGLYRYFGDCKGWWLCTGAHYRVGG